MTQLNVLHLSHTDVSTDSRIQKAMHCLVEQSSAFKVMGIGVAAENGNPPLNESKLSVKLIKLRIPRWKYLPRFIRNAGKVIELFFKMMSHARAFKPNIIHCHDTVALPLAVFLKWRTGAKLIYDAHELESDRNGLNPVTKKLVYWVEKLSWRYVDELIVVGDAIAAWYNQHLGNKSTLVVLNSPLLNEQQTIYEDDYLRRKFSIPDEHKIFIYIGVLDHGRGLEKLLDIFSAKAVTAHFVILGYGALATKVRKIALKASNIHFHERVPHEHVTAIVKSADVGICFIENVSLSDYLCLPNKLFEYCFSGIPVIGSNFPEISRIVEKYHLGYCCRDDRDSMLQAIQKFEKTTTETAFNIKDLYELSWQKQREKLLALYIKLHADIVKHIARKK